MVLLRDYTIPRIPEFLSRCSKWPPPPAPFPVSEWPSPLEPKEWGGAGGGEPIWTSGEKAWHSVYSVEGLFAERREACRIGQIFKYYVQHYFICRPSEFTVSEYAGIEAGTVVTLVLSDALITRLQLTHNTVVQDRAKFSFCCNK
jgi:hypothetical protein